MFVICISKHGAIINIFILTIDQMIMYNVKSLVVTNPRIIIPKSEVPSAQMISFSIF